MKPPETVNDFLTAIAGAVVTIGGIFAVWARGSKTALGVKENSGRGDWMEHLEGMARENVALTGQVADLTAQLRIVTSQLRAVEEQNRRILRLLLAARPDLVGVFASSDFGELGDQ